MQLQQSNMNAWPGSQNTPRINLSDIRDNFLVALICLYCLLNYGFIHIRGPFGIPIGEIILVFSLLAINHKVTLPRFLGQKIALPLLIWWGAGLISALLAVPEYGFWAIRDASHVLESLFLYVGFAFAGRLGALAKLAQWFPRTLLICVFYSLTYPFQDLLRAHAPTLRGPYGQPVPLLFMYTGTANMMIACAALNLQKFVQTNRQKLLYGSAAIVTLALLLIPSRTLFMEVILLMIFFATRLGKHQLKNTLLMIALPIVLLGLVLASGIPIHGRYGAGMSLNDYLQVFLETIPGYHAEDNLTSGTEGRFIWWGNVIDKWRDSFTSMVFGLGYGFPLIDFQVSGGVLVREPHNDFISILGRGGLIGFVSFIWFQIILLVRSFSLSRYFEKHPIYGPLTVAMLFVLLITVVNMIGESPFIMPFYAVPYYFFAGVLLRMYALRKTL